MPKVVFFLNLYESTKNFSKLNEALPKLHLISCNVLKTRFKIMNTTLENLLNNTMQETES